MKKILHLISSPRGENSFSIKLGNAVIAKIQEEYPGSTVKESNLVRKQFPHLEEAHLQAFFTPLESRTPENVVAIKHSDESIAEIMDADIIVIGAPLYNFGIHSTLKAWIDHIARAGITFKYDENGPEGLVKNKKVFQLMSYPNRTHGIYEGAGTSEHLALTFTKFLKEKLPPGPVSPGEQPKPTKGF